MGKMQIKINYEFKLLHKNMWTFVRCKYFRNLFCGRTEVHSNELENNYAKHFGLRRKVRKIYEFCGGVKTNMESKIYRRTARLALQTLITMNEKLSMQLMTFWRRD